MVPVEQFKVVRYAVNSGVAVVTLHRPDRLNAWTGRMHAEYRSALALAAGADAVRAIVVTGAGRGFCAGADTAALDGHAERASYDPGVVADELARPGYGVRPEYDHDFAIREPAAQRGRPVSTNPRPETLGPRRARHRVL